MASEACHPRIPRDRDAGSVVDRPAAARFGYVRAGYTAVTTDAVKTLLGRDPIGFAAFARDHGQTWK
jgi:hypothetical protein